MGDYAYDFSVVPGPDPSYLKDSGAQGVLVYSGNSRQSDTYLDQCRSLGLKVVWIWEENTDSILTADGAAACRDHETRAHPGELTYVACDLNNGALAGRDVTRFCRAWASATREPEFGLYGPSDAIAQGQAAGIPKLTKWWGVVNWITGGGPNNDPRNIAYWQSVGAHLVQLIGSPIANTDQNLILRDDWHSPSTAPAPQTDDEEDAVIYIKKSEDDPAIWVSDGLWKRHIGGDEWKLAQYLNALAGKPALKATPVSWFDDIPVAK